MLSYMVTGIKGNEEVNLKVKELNETKAKEKALKVYKLEEVIDICLFKDFKKKEEPKDPKSYYQSKVIISGWQARKYGGNKY